jgi:hypothetical protein
MAAIDDFALARSSRDVRDATRPSKIPTVLGEVSFFVTNRVSPPVKYDPPLELVHWTNRSGFFGFSGEIWKPESTSTTSLSPGRYRWRVTSDYYQTLEFEDTWPPDKAYDKTKDLHLLPGSNYPFPDMNLPQRDLGITLLRGSLFESSGEGLQNIKIGLVAPFIPSSFVAFKECMTDLRGDWVLAFIEKDKNTPRPDFENSRVRVHLPGGGYETDVRITVGAENTLAQTALRGSVRKKGSPVPNAKITISSFQGVSLSDRNGQWKFFFQWRQQAGPVKITSMAQDGSTVTAEAFIMPGKTVVVPALELS